MTEKEGADFCNKLAEASEAVYQNTVRDKKEPDPAVEEALDKVGALIEERFPHVVGDVRYSGLQVLSSNAGFFIGRTCWVEEDGLPGYQDMGSRESDYFETREEAQEALDSGEFKVRDCLENQWAYSQGLPRPGSE